MLLRCATAVLIVAPMLGVAGCRSASKPFKTYTPTTVQAEPEASAAEQGLRQVAYQPPEASPADTVVDQAVEQTLPPPSGRQPAEPTQPPAEPEEIVAPEETTPPIALDLEQPLLLDVVRSVRVHFPLIQQAAAGRVIASGEALSAAGAFDRKFDSYGNIQPLDFYENHWQKYGIKRDTMWGGQVGAGYRIGRGSFEPWYKERETNDLGEFSLSLRAPIYRDVWIDSNRAELWRAQLERGRIEPVVRAEVIRAVRAGVVAYWEWVAAAARLEVALQVLQLGLDRVDALDKQFNEGDKANIDRVDNRRIIVTRQAKAIDARRKLEQAAAKLSLYLRDVSGRPILPPIDAKEIDFPTTEALDASVAGEDIPFAIATRPELSELNIIRRQLNIAYRQAVNETRPDIDAGLLLAQDAGNPTSSDDKSEFEIEATLTVSVPLERRKALGKVRQLRGKLAQVRAKTQFAAEKVAIEVQVARAALNAAAERVDQTTEGVKLAEEMRIAEERKIEEGDRDANLFTLNAREKQAADAAIERVDAQLDFFVALADYIAALGLDGASLESLYATPNGPANPQPQPQEEAEPAPEPAGDDLP